jgi:hypothetical protein
MATEKLIASASAGLYSNLAADLYQQHSEPVAANFGQCFGRYVLPTHLTPKAVSGDSGDRVITAELDSLVGRQGRSGAFAGQCGHQRRAAGFAGGRSVAQSRRSALGFSSGFGRSDKTI